MPGVGTLRADATSRHWSEAVELAAAQLRRRVLEALRDAAAPLNPHSRLLLSAAGGASRLTRTRPGGQRWR